MSAGGALLALHRLPLDHPPDGPHVARQLAGDRYLGDVGGLAPDGEVGVPRPVPGVALPRLALDRLGDLGTLPAPLKFGTKRPIRD